MEPEPHDIIRLECCNLDVLPDLQHLRTTALCLDRNRFRFLQPGHLPPRLTYLSIVSNSLTSANIFHQTIYPSIETLVLDRNYIHGLYDLATSAPNLKHLSLQSNSIHRIETLTVFQNLESLYLGDNSIDVLDCIPMTLKVLEAPFCRIRMVQSRMPPSIVKINLSSNSLNFAGLPFTWGCIRELDLGNNRLQKFPRKLPDCLEILYIQDNKIVEMPDTLPESLRVLVASNNRIRVLPDYKNRRLELLSLSNNKLTTLETGTKLAHVFLGDLNWNTYIHSVVASRIAKLWRRYCLQLRLRSIVRTQRLRGSLLEAAMRPSRIGKFEPIPRGWLDSSS